MSGRLEKIMDTGSKTMADPLSVKANCTQITFCDAPRYITFTEGAKVPPL